MHRLTERLCAFAEDFRLADCPPRIAELAGLAMTDVLGVMVDGAGREQPRLARQALSPWGDSIFDRILTASMAAHSAEFNDLWFEIPGHPSAVIAPAALLVGEAVRASGAALLEAYLVGLETASRVNRALLPAHQDRGFHSTCVSGVLGAALACGRLLGLDRAGLADALGIGCSLAGGLRRNFGAFANALQVGSAAANGARAAYYARSGIGSGRDLLAGPDGFLAAFHGNPQRAEALFDSLGKTFCFDEPGLLIKKYPACYSVYQSVDAALELCRSHRIRDGEIDRVTCLVPELSFTALPCRTPDSPYEARFCVPYCVAAAVVTDGLENHAFTPELLRDPRIARLLAVTDYGVPDELRGGQGYGFSEVRLTLRGEQLTARAFPNPAERLENWDSERLRKKFASCCREHLPQSSIREALELLSRLGELELITPLLALLRQGADTASPKGGSQYEME